MINWRMISHPMNWITFMLMVLIAGSFGHYALSLAGIEPNTPRKRSSYDDMPAGQSPGQAASGAIDPQGSYEEAMY